MFFKKKKKTEKPVTKIEDPKKKPISQVYKELTGKNIEDVKKASEG